MKQIPPEIIDYIRYEPDTGLFFWRDSSRRNKRKDRRVGSIGTGGYIRLMFSGKSYQAHRVAFTCMGIILTNEVDHINGNRADNRWENLREVSRKEQCKNIKARGEKTPGVYFKPSRGKKPWVAQISVNTKVVHLGSFTTETEAVAARKQAEQEHGFHANHGRKAPSAKYDIQKIRKDSNAQYAQARQEQRQARRRSDSEEVARV